LDVIDQFISESDETPQTIDEARRLFHAVREDRNQYDNTLTRHARHWELSRLALVDRNILRMAVYELFAGSEPDKVVMNEAIQLAKQFSSAESPRFINGIIDAVAKEIRKDVSRDTWDTGDNNLKDLK